MAPRQATSKGTAKKVAKVFASKTVKDILEKLITRSVEGENSNKKTLEKWASKMKLSVLKKISEASKIAFLSKESRAESIRIEIEAIKLKIIHQTETIRVNAILRLEKSKVSESETSACEISYQSGRFDLQASEIKDQFREVAHQLTSNLTDIVGCVNSFQSSVDATNLDWKHINVRLAADSNKTSSSITTRRISSLQKSKITPVEILYNHLEHTI